MTGPRIDKYDISRGQYLKRAYTRRTEKAPAGQRKAIGGSLFCVGKREKEGWTYRRKNQKSDIIFKKQRQPAERERYL